MRARPWRNMVWSSASSTLIGPFMFAFVIWFSPNPSCSVPLVRPEGIVSSTLFRATDLRLFFDVMGHITTVHRASSSAIHPSAWNGHSRKFASKEFSEVRKESFKSSSFGGCAHTHRGGCYDCYVRERNLA